MPRALVRGVSDAIRDAVRVDPVAIDAARARAQHEDYVRGLAWLGYEVVALPPEPAMPDAIFVEDQAVVVGRRAFVPVVGHPARRAETDSVAAALERLGLEVVRARQGTLDGGDVLRVGRTLWVGRSARTDDVGVRLLAAAATGFQVRRAPLPAGVLHLKSVCSSPVARTVVVAEGALPPETWEGHALRILTVPAAEGWAANVVGLGNRALVGDGFPAAAAVLAEAGLEVRAVDVSEIRKADAALTCLSILLP